MGKMDEMISYMKNSRYPIFFLGGEVAHLSYDSLIKKGITGASKRLAIELENFGIRVNAVAPGLTATELTINLSEIKKPLP